MHRLATFLLDEQSSSMVSALIDLVYGDGPLFSILFSTLLIRWLICSLSSQGTLIWLTSSSTSMIFKHKRWPPLWSWEFPADWEFKICCNKFIKNFVSRHWTEKMRCSSMVKICHPLMDRLSSSSMGTLCRWRFDQTQTMMYMWQSQWGWSRGHPQFRWTQCGWRWADHHDNFVSPWSSVWSYRCCDVGYNVSRNTYN